MRCLSWKSKFLWALSAFTLGRLLYSKHIALVPLPFEDSILPFRAILEQFQKSGFEISFAAHQGFEKWTADIDYAELIYIPNMNNTIRMPPMPCIGDELGFFSRVWNGKALYRLVSLYFQTYLEMEPIMFSLLLNLWSAKKPDFVVLDRFAFGAISACKALEIPFVVNNPHLLLDLDFPPLYVSPPFSGSQRSKQTVWGRLAGLYHRILFRLVLINMAAQLKHSPVIKPIGNKVAWSNDPLVLTNTVFGIEDARPLSPLTQMTGPLLPNYRNSSLFDEKNRSTKWILVALDDQVQRTSKILDALYETFNNSTEVYLIVHMSESISNEVPEYFVTLSENTLFLTNPLDALSVLRNDKLVTVICSGQLQFTQAALYAHKPVILIPSSPEQFEITTRITNLLAGVYLDLSGISNQKIVDAFQKVQEDQSILWGVKRASTMLQSSGGAVLARTLIIDAFEHGVGDLQPTHSHLKWWERLQFDVYGIYGIILCCMVLVLKTMWGFLWALCKSEKEGEDEQTSLQKVSNFEDAKNHSQSKASSLSTQIKQQNLQDLDISDNDDDDILK